MNKYCLSEIRSGGQSGVDRAALDAAILNNIPHSGWCPKGRLSETGMIPLEYQLKETPSNDYAQRTMWNIRDSDATLILVPSLPLKVTDGTILTIDEVKKQNKPHLIVDLSTRQDVETLVKWIKESSMNILNIAGPRESQSSGIYAKSFLLLKDVFADLNVNNSKRAKL